MGKNKKNTSNFVITFPLETEKWQEDKLNYWFKHVNILNNRLIDIIRTTIKDNQDKFTTIKELNKKINKFPDADKLTKEQKEELAKLKEERTAILNSIPITEAQKVKFYPQKSKSPFFSEFGLISISIAMLKESVGGEDEKGKKLTYNSLFPCVHSSIASQIGKNKYNSFKKWLFGNGKEIHFKKESELKSISFELKDKDNLETRFCYIDTKNHNLILNKQTGFNKGKKMVIPFKVKKYGTNGIEGIIYEDKALNCPLTKVTIKREKVRGKYKFYLQLTVEGVPYNKERIIGHGVAGIDPGTRKVTYYGDEVLQYKLPDDLIKLNDKKASLQRAIDRSKRKLNPNKYNEDGTIKKNNKDKWNISKNCQKKQDKVREIDRKIAAKRNIYQDEFVNKILSESDTFKVEKNNIESFKRRSKGIRVNKNGKIQSNKRYGKSINECAPASLLVKLHNKCNAMGCTYYEIDAKQASATGTDHTKFNKGNDFSQYSHDEYYTKVPTKYTSVELTNGNVHDRDAHAAFNLKFYDKFTHKYDIEGMKKDYQHFCDAENKAFQNNEINPNRLEKTLKL